MILENKNLKKLQTEQNSKLFDMIQQLKIPSCECEFSDAVKAKFQTNDTLKNQIYQTAKALKPWRKGPFYLNDLFIDTEWKSFIKFNILKPYMNLENKTVADVGCNNGYYMFKMLEFNPKKIVGFDPSAIFYLQFLFINKFLKSNIIYELLGVEDLPTYAEKFDTIFCLGVIYHRSDPLSMLKQLKSSLNTDGEVFLDTMFIDMPGDFALCPKNSYSKISNIHFIPTIGALQNWCERAKFKKFEILSIKTTDFQEQRKTQWIDGQSLENFLDPNDHTKTIEGYPAPKRIYVKLGI